MIVSCPQCGNAGVVHYDKDKKNAVFKCGACYIKKYSAIENTGLEVNAQCTSTKRFFRIIVSSKKIHGQKVQVKCPYCEEFVMGNLLDTLKTPTIIFQDIRHAKDPFFHYPLYFQISYRGEIIWALNREHLQWFK